MQGKTETPKESSSIDEQGTRDAANLDEKRGGDGTGSVPSSHDRLKRNNPSPSFEKALRSLGLDIDISAVSIVEELKKLHPEYGGSDASKLRLIESATADKKSALLWIEELRTLYSPQVQQLHGRYAIYGLSLLDRNLEEQLAKKGFLSKLLLEIEFDTDGPFEDKLTSKGVSLKNARTDSVPIHQDVPTEVDMLGREAFAQALANRIRSNQQTGMKKKLRTVRGAFLVLIHGPWGAGKSTLLNFLRRYLENRPDRLHGNSDDTQWITVHYNAWQYQRLDAPWWFLMKRIISQSVRALFVRRPHRALWVWSASLLWRSFHSQWRYLIYFPLFVWMLIFFFDQYSFEILGNAPGGNVGDGNVDSNNSKAFDLKGFSTVLAVLITLWSILKGIGDTVFHGTVRAAKSYVESTSDPMGRLARHFEKTINRIDSPVAVFIDDLDRCQGAYAIELLEAIQTLFRSSPVVFVIAADRRWLITSYQDAYADYAKTISEAGRPLGYLFMEKTFQLTAAVPRISEDTQREYWQYLLKNKQKSDPAELLDARRKAAEKLGRLTTENEVLDRVKDHQSDSVEDIAYRQEAMLRLSIPEVEKDTAKHILADCGVLLEPNPRTMKRMLNEYGTLRALDILRGGKTGQQELALWTILTLQWPELAEHLEQNPKDIKYFSAANPSDGAESLGKLITDPDIWGAIKKVVTGDGIKGKLDVKAVKACTGLRTQESSLA
ncbi:MAG: hypothetical protein IIA59_09415 [Candidatus Marinimicrobia bacterium]|nr:hypothetical protein [Candidatus Neomarinimicrobiota bacterium]